MKYLAPIAIAGAVALDWDGDQWTYLEVLTIVALPAALDAWARVRAASLHAAGNALSSGSVDDE